MTNALRETIETPVDDHVDVLVAGGGPSGLIAAAAAARLGAKTLLVERSGCLGGTATSGMVAQFFGFFHEDTRVVHGLPQELLDRVTAYGGATGFTRYTMAEASLSPVSLYSFPFNPEILKIAADEIVSEAGSRILLRCLIVGVIETGRRVEGVILEGVGGRRAIRANVIIDATGDAVVSTKAGAEVVGEDAELRRNRQPMTLVFRLADVDVPTFRALPREEKRRLVMKGIGQGDLFWESLAFSSTPANNDALCLLSRLRGLDALDPHDLTRAELAGRQQIKRILPFLRNEVPGFASCNLVGIAAGVGIRETRRIVGQYTLTEEDVLASRTFEDAIALGTGPVDVHDPQGTGFVTLRMPDRPFQIPMRCLLPASIEGVIATGRIISATRSANGAARHMGTAMALGQAAGAVAAVAANNGVSPTSVSPREAQKLLRNLGAGLESPGA